MTERADARVLLIHGLWMPKLSMLWLAGRLREAGFATELFGYPTIAGGPGAALPILAKRLRDRPGHVLAHSLGGLVTLSALEFEPDLPVRRVVCLGSPLRGSAAAQTLAQQAWSRPYLGRSARLLRSGCQPWRGQADVGVVAGSTPLGLGRYFGRFDGDNDGTVSVEETRLPGLADHVVIPTSHTGLLFSPDAARLAVGFFRDGRFPARGSAGPIE
ncbi:esterase/lipase family protein [Lysobacter auxotrophicus]|uniref:Alpha/beta fold hydrolase n=1 Tax=Lysobacter auxotrophicus TaxID=2992573 RepID=A0ABM8DAN7_9GAMM|nr:alpha/beta hydrolase [Lysobacter auxotrophicus]BDU15598.1 alpha/beta fold hydrolase [Lysobacter auxotrophicus]